MNRILSITWGADHVAPLSVERIIARLALGGLLPDPWNSVNRSISSPLGRTTIWWPMVAWSLSGAKMARAGSHVLPPSVVREKIASPRNEKACWALKLARSLGSRASVVGSLQVSPPLVDLLTRTAVAGSLTKFTDRLI